MVVMAAGVIWLSGFAKEDGEEDEIYIIFYGTIGTATKKLKKMFFFLIPFLINIIFY